MRRIRIPNNLLDKNYRTYLDADYSSGTALTVPNNASFAANDFLVCGEPREEKTELRQVSSLTGNTTININSAFRFSHNKATTLYKTPWDFVSIERRTSSAGAWSEISQSGIQWDNKLNETVYFDSAATSAYQYRFRYYNSSSLTYSEYSDTQDGTTPSRASVRYMVDEVRKLTNDTDRKIIQSDDEIIRAFNEAQDIIYTHNPRYWFLYVDTHKLGSLSIATTAGNDEYTLANLTNYGHLAGIVYEYNSGGTHEIYRLRKIADAEFDKEDQDLNATNDDWPTVFKLLPADASSANGYFKITPNILTSSVGTFYPLYYEKMANLDSPADSTQVPLPQLLINHAVAFVERIKGNEAKATIYERGLIENSDRKNPPVPTGLAMLDKLDNAQKDTVGQPRQVWRFRGQKAISRLYGSKTISSTALDARRENYF